MGLLRLIIMGNSKNGLNDLIFIFFFIIFWKNGFKELELLVFPARHFLENGFVCPPHA